MTEFKRIKCTVLVIDRKIAKNGATYSIIFVEHPLESDDMVNTVSKLISFTDHNIIVS